LGEISGPQSLIQVKKIQHSIQKVTQKLKRGVEETMVKALVSLATNEFADQGAVLAVIRAIQEVKDTILEGLDFEHAEEKNAVELYNEEITDRTKDNKRLAREINITKGEIEGTEKRISIKEALLELKKNDLEGFQGEESDENDAFESATNFYEDVRGELVREQSVGQDTLAILNNAGFSASINANIGL
jgi:Rad3-related DNA helicase